MQPKSDFAAVSSLHAAEIQRATLGAGALGFAVQALSQPGGPVIHLATDPATDADAGRIALLVQNNGSAEVILTPASRFAVAFAHVLTETQVAGIRAVDAAWQPDPKGTTLILRPAGVIRVEAGQTIYLELDRVLATGDARTSQIRIDYAGIDGIVEDGTSLLVFVHNPARFQRTLLVDYKFLARRGPDDPGDTVFVNPPFIGDRVENSLELLLYNSSPDQPILLPPDGKPWPRFIVSFVAGGLAREDDIDGINVSPKQGDPAKPWSAGKDTQGGVATFLLQPPRGSEELFQGRSEALVSFLFDTVVTTLPPGVTLMYIQHAGVANYDDGFAARPIQKMPLLDLTVTAAGKVVNGSGTVDWGPVGFAWNAHGQVDYPVCSLLQNGVAVAAADTAKAVGNTVLTPPDPPPGPVDYTFIANTRPAVERHLRLTFRPVIPRFEASADHGLVGDAVVLRWESHGANARTITGPGVSQAGLPAAGELKVTLPDQPAGPLGFRLTCTGPAGTSATRDTAVRLLGKFTASAHVTGSDVAISWATSNADSVQVSVRAELNNGSGTASFGIPAATTGSAVTPLYGNYSEPFGKRLGCTVAASFAGSIYSRVFDFWKA
jgi:hypothetical protein